jgi:hypothetical protein
MKKVFIFGLSVALVAGSVTSCKKTSTGKVSNEWKTTSWNSTETSTNANGDVETTTVVSTDGTALVFTTVSTPNGGSATTSTVNGTVNDLSYTINKDGTFENISDMSLTFDFTGGSVASNMQTTSTGTWSFVSANKTAEFKKNERVIFHTLSMNSTETQTMTIGGAAQPSDVSSSVETYAPGENSQIYLVVESKGKILSLKSEEAMTGSSTDSNGTSTSSSMSTLEFTLEQK